MSLGADLPPTNVQTGFVDMGLLGSQGRLELRLKAAVRKGTAALGYLKAPGVATTPLAERLRSAASPTGASMRSGVPLLAAEDVLELIQLSKNTPAPNRYCEAPSVRYNLEQ